MDCLLAWEREIERGEGADCWLGIGTERGVNGLIAGWVEGVREG